MKLGKCPWDGKTNDFFFTKFKPSNNQLFQNLGMRETLEGEE